MKHLNFLSKSRWLLVPLMLITFGVGNVWGAENDTHDFAQSLSQLLNNNASISSINIAEQNYPVKEVIISFRYNKTIEDAVTMGVSVGGTSWGTQNSTGTGNNYSTKTFSHESATGAIVISFTNNTGSGTGHGTFYVNNVQLVEGAPTAPADPFTVTLMDNGATLTEESAGDGVILPSREGCSGYTFAGWTKSWNSAQTEWTTTAPTIIPTGSYTPTANENLYPVYTKTEGGGSSIVTFTPGTDTGETSVTKSGVTCTMTTMNNASYYQIYASQSGTFSVASGNITAISFTCTASGTSKYGPGNASADVGTYSYSGSTGSWSGSASSITISSTAQIRMTALSITCSGGSSTSYISVPNCCTPLGSINGSVSGSQVSWIAVTGASGYKVKVDNGDWTDIGNVLSYTPTLACGSGNHNVYVKAYNTNNSGHCTGDGPESAALVVASAACTEPEITASPTSLSNLNYIVGQGASAAQSFSINGTNLTSGTLTVTAPANFEVSKASGSGWASSITFTGVSGTLDATTVYVRLASGKSAGEYSGNVAITGCGLASAVNVGVSGSVLKPTITADPTSISDWSTQTGTAPSPATKTITVTGSNLKADISASLTAGGDYFTITPSGLAQSEGSVNGSVVIGVKAAAYASAGTPSGTLSLSTTDGDNADVTFSLTVTDDPREKFTLMTDVDQLTDGARIVLLHWDNVFEEYDQIMSTSFTDQKGFDETNSGFEMLSENTIVALSVVNSAQVLELVEQTPGQFALYDGTNYVAHYTSGNKLTKVAAGDIAARAIWTPEIYEDGTHGLKNTEIEAYYIGRNSTTTPSWRCYNNNDYCSYNIFYKASTTPKVNISGTLDAFTYMRNNGPSAAQLFKVRGNNLSENLVVTAPTNYEVCKTENGTYEASVAFTPSEGSVAESNVYIRLKSGLAINSYNGDITVSSTGATNATKAVTGSVTTPVYTVTLNTNGGTINAGNVTEYTEGVGATLPSDVTKSGYSFDGWFDNEGLSGSAVTTIATNATGAKTYWAKWTELPGCDITWLVDCEAYTGGEPDVHVVYNGSISKLPSTPTSLDITSKTFVGWTTAAVNDKQADAPDPLYTAASQIPGNITENKTFYAVFAQETHSGTFTKVTDASTLAAGDRLLIYASNYAAGTLGSNNYLSRESVTTNNNEVTDKGNASVFTLGGTSSSWTLTSAEGTLKCYGTNNNNLSMSTGTATWVITINSGDATIKPTDLTTYIKYNSSGNRFSSYASGQTTPQLYREGTTRTNYTTKFVKPVAVTGVTLNKDATTLAIGATETLTATVAPQNATNKNVSWSSNAEGVATVTSAGVVTAVAAGEATITVTTEDGSFTDECVVTVLPTVATPTFSPAAGAINKGSKVEISCGTADATILYSIDGSDPSVAYPEGGVTINANCTLKAKATKANYTTSAVAQAAYTIIKASQTVSFAESAISFRLNSTEYTAFTGQTASSTYGSAVITYASSNTSVAEVNTNTGAVTLKGVKGTTTITATAAEDADYQSDSETYTITVLRAGKTRTGDFVLVTNANQLADGDYILLTSETRNGYGDPDYASVFSGITSSAGTFENKNVANDEITYAQLGNTAKIIYLEKVTVGNIDYWAFNYGSDNDIYIAALTYSSNGLNSEGSTSDYSLWSISIGANNVANVTNKGNSGHGVLSYNTQGSGAFKAYAQLQSGSLRIYKQKDKNKLPQTLSFATASYEFPLNESAYTSFAHQTVSGAQTAVTYTSSNASVAAIVENTVVLQGGVGTATITATAAESEDYEHASATYTITVTAALNTVTFHYYKPADATADQTALKELTSGAGITVPAKPADVGEYTFLGWAPATLDETQTAPTNLVAALQAGATYHPSANGEEYFAIYRRLENSDGRFYLKHNSYYAQAPASSTSTNLQNTNKLSEAAVFGIDGDKFYYYEGSTKRYISSVVTSGSTSEKRVLSFTPDIDDAKAWTIVETATNITLQSSINNLYLYHNGNLWAAYASLTESETVTKDLTKVYLANVYYTSTPNKMVSPVLTWAQGNETKVLEIEETYDNAATATVNDVPVSVTYSSSDETKATVDNAGVVTAHLGGLVTITATVAENPGVSRQLVETYQVSITKKVPQIVFDNEANWKVYVGEAYKRVLAGQVTITTDGDVTYTLSNNATSSEWASINSGTGEVTGLSTGGQSSKFQNFYVHTAETDMYQSGEAYKQFNVLAPKSQTLTFGQNAYVFEMNESVAPFVNTLNGAYTTVTYASDNTSIAEVNAASGEVTVHTNVRGTATITATAAEGQVGDDVYKQVPQKYTITVNYPKPIISVASCEFKAPFEVSLSANATDVAMIVYTTDGSTPSYNENTNGEEYDGPITINASTTLKAIAVSNDEVESPVASATYTKLIPALAAWSFEDGANVAIDAEQTITASEGAVITYIISKGGVEVASATTESNVATFTLTEAGNYEVEAEAQWNVANGFVSASVSRTIHVKGATHLPISYDGNGADVSSEPYFSVEGVALGDYANYSNAPIQVKGNTILTIAFLDEPSNVVFYAGKNGSPWTSTLKLQESADGLTFDDVKTFSDGDLEFSNTGYGNNNGGTKQNLNLKSTTRFVRWNYTKDNGNLALGKITIYPKSMEPDNEYSVPIDFTGDVVVEDGEAWNVTEAQTINDLTVKQGAELWNNAAITVNNLYLEAQEGKSGQITEDESITIVGNAYYDLTLNTRGTMDNSKWYAFAVPFQVDAATGIQRLSNDGVASNAGFNSHYVLLKYNSAAYASSGQGWEYVTRGETLMPGKFYMIALNSNAYNRVRMTKKAGTPVNNKANLTLSTVGSGLHANWNALANNALAYANVSATGLNADLKVQVYNSAEDSYTAYEYGKVTFTVGTPFFIQVAEAGTMSIVTGESNHETLKAPARAAVATEEFKLRLGADTESFYDQLYVSASDEALNEYQIGHDLAKAGISTTVPQMYIPAYGAKLCDAEFPLVNNEATFPLTFTAPNAGTYQLYIAKAASDAELYLQKDGATIWNLTMGAYALELPQGTTEGYGLLLKAKAPGSATGIENGGMLNGANGVQKVIIDDHVYILRGGQMYDVTGKAVK